MAFINKEDPVVLNIMLTSKGREKLSIGKLNFKYFAVGDSEIDYNFNREIINIDPNYNQSDVNILLPKDVNPQIISFISKQNDNNIYNEIGTIAPYSYEVVNDVQSIGFFSKELDLYNIGSQFVKQPDLMVDVSLITGGTSLNLKKSPTYGNSLLEPSIGDFLLIKWTHTTHTTGHTYNENIAQQNLFYRIIGKTGTLNLNNIKVVVDRELPNYFGRGASGKAGALVYYSGFTNTDPFPPNYLNESVLSFIDNYSSSIAKYPFWKISIIFTEELLGVMQNDRKFGQFKTRNLGGFLSYIQNQQPTLKKIGVIHYTNNSPANVYGESFYQKTPIIEIPSIMWHKSETNVLGVKLICVGDQKIISNENNSLDTYYYDLADEGSGFVVGKVLNDLKIFIIEDQELLFALSYKSNRSWTLPDYNVGLQGLAICPNTIDPPVTPTIQIIELLNNNSLNLVWSNIIYDSADIKYVLYRKDNVYSSWVIIDDDLVSNTYLDNNLTYGNTYYYMVVAVGSNQLSSKESNVIDYTIPNITSPTVSILNDIVLYGEICNSFNLTWSQSETTNQPIRYELYRKDDVNTNWVLISDNNLSIENFVDEGLINDYTYYYKVFAIDSNNIRSSESNVVNKKVECIT